MLPRKKLEFYASKYGIQKPTDIKLTQEDCVRICGAVGTKVYSAKDVGCRISVLIDCIMDDPDYAARTAAEMRAAHPDKEIREDFIAVRIADHAADDVLKAYAH